MSIQKLSELTRVQNTKATVSGTTGSPTVTSYTAGGITYDVYSFTASSGSIVFGSAGRVDVLLVGGGGGGGTSFGGGGGGGGFVELNGIYCPAGSAAVVVGAAGTAGSSNIIWGGAGGVSSFTANGTLYAVGGGGGGGSGAVGNQQFVANGACGGGGTNTANSFGQANPGMGSGFIGSNGDGGHGGCGGGAGAAPVGFVAGIGKQSSITGSAVYYASGGNGEVCSANASRRAVVNSGDGATAATAGYTGIVIVRVAR